MPFDSIMGVGRSPKITEDIQTNPFSLSANDIAQAALMSVTGTSSSTVGSVNNIIDPDYPSDVIAFEDLSLFTITADLKKTIYTKKLRIDYQITTAPGTAVHAFFLEISTDGVNYTRLLTTTITAVTEVIPIEFNFKKFRFVRFGVEQISGGVASERTAIYKLKIILDELQY